MSPKDHQGSLPLIGMGILAFLFIVGLIIFVVIGSHSKKEDPPLQTVPMEFSNTPFYMPANRDPTDFPKERERLKPRTPGLSMGTSGDDPLKNNKDFQEGGLIHTLLQPSLEQRKKYE